MNKIEFENYPSTNTPINTENLNQMQDNIENAVGNIDTSRISAIENKDIEQDGRLDVIETKDTEQDTRMTSIENKVFGLEKNILQLAIVGNRVLGSSPRTIDNWVENNKTGNKLTATSTGVRIGAGASMIKISAYVAYRHLISSGEITTPYLYLEKNGNLYRSYSYNKVDASLQSVAMIIPSAIMPATEGDVIGLSVVAGSTSRYDAGSYLTVEVIE